MNVEIQKQVVSLKLSRKLKELGAMQESLYFYEWHKVDSKKRAILSYYPDRKLKAHPAWDACAAFTVAELGKMLPDGGLWAKDKSGSVRTYKVYGVWWCEYCVGTEAMPSPMSAPKYRQCADTEADARSKMLVYLIENGHLN